MKYTKETLDDIMLDAKHGLSLKEIAIRLCIPVLDFFTDYKNKESKVKLYYDSGRAQGKIETDKALFELAKNGSTSAKESYDKKMKNADLSNEIYKIHNG